MYIYINYYTAMRIDRDRNVIVDFQRYNIITAAYD